MTDLSTLKSLDSELQELETLHRYPGKLPDPARVAEAIATVRKHWMPMVLLMISCDQNSAALRSFIGRHGAVYDTTCHAISDILRCTDLACEPRRFFRLDDGGAMYFLVARDRNHAEQVIRDAQVDLADGVSYATAVTNGLLRWSEISSDDAAKLTCHTQDDRGAVPLSEAKLGEWFCTEW